MNVLVDAMIGGTDFNISDAYTVNGQPGVWLLHCHLERHFSWGMTTVFIVLDGETDEARLLPPPTGMPKCSDADLMTKPFDQPDEHEGNDMQNEWLP
ncbi:Laccase-14 [Nymphaea thermarum]|nr:Laccase-14 [Nymphaea thermarum]